MNGKHLLIWGASGHAKVLAPIARSAGHRLAVFFDANRTVHSPITALSCIHSWGELKRWLASEEEASLAFAIAVGGIRGRERLDIADRLQGLGLEPVQLIHHRSWIADSATVGQGAQVLAMAGVGEHVTLGEQCIVNTNATIDHECEVGDNVHIMPGATVAGCVTIGSNVAIGANATILPKLTIGSGAIIGAGAVVTGNVPAGATVVGNPARALPRPINTEGAQ